MIDLAKLGIGWLELLPDLSNILGAVSASTGLAGAGLLALKNNYSKWAWPIWLLSNLCWVIVGVQREMWDIVIQNSGFSVTSFIGLWVWWIKPAFAAKQA